MIRLNQSKLLQLYKLRKTDHCSGRGAGSIDVGMETRTHSGTYDWDGLERGDSARPVLLLQMTMDGWGHFRGSGRWNRVGPGSLFTAAIPSNHRYRLPEPSPFWSFSWMIIEHPEFVTRLMKRTSPLNRIWSGLESAPLGAIMEEVFVGVCCGRLQDPWLREEAIFRLALGIEREASGENPSHPWAIQLRELLAVRLDSPPKICEIAAHFHLSRSAFSHAFRRRTGATPAAFLHELRLVEAGRRLKEKRISIKEVAAATGFQDAAQFAKAFRKRFGLPPSAYRSWFHN